MGPLVTSHLYCEHSRVEPSTKRVLGLRHVQHTRRSHSGHSDHDSDGASAGGSAHDGEGNGDEDNTHASAVKSISGVATHTR
jgi:hypothetical protein